MSVRTSVRFPSMRAIFPLAVALAMVLTSSAAGTASTASSTGADCGLAGDAPGTFSSAALLVPPLFECTGEIFGGDEDWYAIDVEAGESLHVLVTYDYMKPPYESLHVCIYRPDGTTHDCSLDREWLVQDAMPGRWVVRLYHSIDADADYRLTLSTKQQYEEPYFLIGTWDDYHMLPGHGVNGYLGPSEHDGLDGDWVELNQTAQGGEYIDTDGAELFFYDEEFAEIPAGRCGAWTFCEVPAGTRWLYVTDTRFDDTWHLVYYYG